MDERTREKLAESLTAETTDLIPFLPYLLQDFWSLGAPPEDVLALLTDHPPASVDGAVPCALDLACGKGAVSIALAKALGMRVKGIDLMEAFLEEGRRRAEAEGVGALCTFVHGDVNEAVRTERGRDQRGWDLTIWGAAGNLLGAYSDTVRLLAETVRPGGLLIIDDGVVESEEARARQRFSALPYPTLAEWHALFAQNGLRVLASHAFDEGPESNSAGEPAYAQDLANISRRADELAARHPEHRAMFAAYVQSQRAEYEDLAGDVTGTMWLLQKRA